MPSHVLGAKIRDGLLWRSSELDKILIDKDIIKLHARGYCMYPSISPGDILQARYKKFQEINIGEVIIFQQNGVLFAHRVIRKQENVKDSGLITQADRSLSEDTALATSQNILGVLVAVERKGRIIDFDREPLKLQSKILFRILLFMDVFKSKTKSFFSRFLEILSQQQIYFFSSRFLFPLVKQRLEFLFSVPFQLGKIGEFYKIVSFDDLVADAHNLSNQESFCFKITIKEKHRFIANAVFFREVYRNEYKCRIDSLNFRMRYSAPRIIYILINKANEILKGMSNLYFFVDESDTVAVQYSSVFLKSGFVKKGDYLEFNSMLQ
jgi:hypothetical protein